VKVRIIEEAPGELHAKAADVVRVVERLSGVQLLKAAPAPDKQIKQTPAKFEYPVLAAPVARGRAEADRIKSIMDPKLLAILGG